MPSGTPAPWQPPALMGEEAQEEEEEQEEGRGRQGVVNCIGPSVHPQRPPKHAGQWRPAARTCVNT